MNERTEYVKKYRNITCTLANFRSLGRGVNGKRHPHVLHLRLHLCRYVFNVYNHCGLL